MKKLITAGLALSALLAASGQSRALVNYPWCVHGDTRGLECYFASKEQCAADGRGRGFGSQCIQNPDFDPTRGPLGEPASYRPNDQHPHKKHHR